MNTFFETLNERKGELLTAVFEHLSLSIIALPRGDRYCCSFSYLAG